MATYLNLFTLCKAKWILYIYQVYQECWKCFFAVHNQQTNLLCQGLVFFSEISGLLMQISSCFDTEINMFQFANEEHD